MGGQCDGKIQQSDGFRGPIITNEVSYIVHGTFVDYPATRPPSLDEFFHPRLSRSVPVSGIEEVPFEIADETAAKQTSSQFAPAVAVLHLAEALPLQGEMLLPSLGSQGHYEERCKPCAFIWTDEGCKNGSVCSFCHLCEPGAKKRRQKEKKKVRALAKLHQSLFSRNNSARGCEDKAEESACHHFNAAKFCELPPSH